ncbi:MBL fold metallo-hydrolase [Cupriavidus sp. L7L]|uniref:MBL fold metallo-hydrolase n=1 Tax=Cupriavidus sp. L7L TaxID=2546443 RepID=UPI001055FFEB|nr:MBL fold metallo-hydrolase [Cupriavidus sp. L7L]TDF56774.1 MBL fold metallo-hydrolase [Cupriavidus sp. L7L]
MTPTMLWTAITILMGLMVAGIAPTIALGDQRDSMDPARMTSYEPPPPAERGLMATFFGTTSIALSDGETVVMVDAFFSRPPLKSWITGNLAPDSTRIDSVIAETGMRRINAIFVAHSHHDHALDAGSVAVKTGADVYGSASSLWIADAAGLPRDRQKLLNDRQQTTIGRFHVTAFETEHSPKSLFSGDITEPISLPTWPWAFKAGSNHSFLMDHPAGRILIVPSASPPKGAFSGVKADVVFLSIARLAGQPEADIWAYWEEAVVRTGARYVIPIHWDDFTRGLDKQLVSIPSWVDDVTSSAARLTQYAKLCDVKISRMPQLKTIWLHRPAASTRENPPTCRKPD